MPAGQFCNGVSERRDVLIRKHGKHIVACSGEMQVFEKLPVIRHRWLDKAAFERSCDEWLEISQPKQCDTTSRSIAGTG